MAETNVKVRLLSRVKTAAEWAANDEILYAKEVGYVSDQGYAYKVGDGTSKFSELSFAIAKTAYALNTPVSVTIGNTTLKIGDGGSAISWSLEDIGAAAIDHGTHVEFSTDNPKATGTASPGTSTTVSRSDHVHPTPSYASTSGSAGSATKLTTSRTITIGGTGKSFDGTEDISWTLDEIGAAAKSHTHSYAGSISAGGSANSAVKLGTERTLTIGSTGKTFDGSADVSWSLSEIGAAASDHTHSVYLPLSGGTVDGTVAATKFVGDLEGDASSVCGFKIVAYDTLAEYEALATKDPNTIYLIKESSASNGSINPAGISEDVDDSAVVTAVTDRVSGGSDAGEE